MNTPTPTLTDGQVERAKLHQDKLKYENATVLKQFKPRTTNTSLDFYGEGIKPTDLNKTAVVTTYNNELSPYNYKDSVLHKKLNPA